MSSNAHRTWPAVFALVNQAKVDETEWQMRHHRIQQALIQGYSEDIDTLIGLLSGLIEDPGSVSSLGEFMLVCLPAPVMVLLRRSCIDHASKELVIPAQ